MAIAIVCQNKDPQPWVEALARIAPELDVRVWPQDSELESVSMALVWAHPEGALKRYPNLKTVVSMGAGIDHINNDPKFPEGVAVARIVDPKLLEGMRDYLSSIVEYQRHHFGFYQQQQSLRQWSPRQTKARQEFAVGILGLGQLGGNIAEAMASNGYRVHGWAASAKSLQSVSCWYADDGLSEMLPQVDLLINLLPLTPKTAGILNYQTLSKLPQGASLINVGRGGHLLEDDLVELLDAGRLACAWLDVFQQEPLGSEHPFWQHPKIRITPHISSLTSPDSVAPQVVENYRRTQQERALLNQVDLSRGY